VLFEQIVEKHLGRFYQTSAFAVFLYARTLDALDHSERRQNAERNKDADNEGRCRLAVGGHNSCAASYDEL
jgi:hypothetical protein